MSVNAITLTRDEARTILGVTAGATADELRRAWRRRAAETHPDRGGDPDEFLRVGAAYELLCRPEPEPAATPRGEKPREREDQGATHAGRTAPKPPPVEPDWFTEPVVVRAHIPRHVALRVALAGLVGGLLIIVAYLSVPVPGAVVGSVMVYVASYVAYVLWHAAGRPSPAETRHFLWFAITRGVVIRR